MSERASQKGLSKANDSYSEKDHGMRESEDQHNKVLRETALQPPKTLCSLTTKESKRNTMDAHL